MSQGAFDLASYNSIPAPRLLYKYFKYHSPEKNEWTQRIFTNNEIYFAAPKDFNDPFDSVRRLADPGPGPGPRNYPPEALTGVILGCRMDESNREQIKQWCRKRKPRPMLYEANEKKREFGLDIIQVAF